VCADADLVQVAQTNLHALLDPPAVDARSVATVRVDDDADRSVHLHAAMQAAHLIVFDVEVALGTAADPGLGPRQAVGQQWILPVHRHQHEDVRGSERRLTALFVRRPGGVVSDTLARGHPNNLGAGRRGVKHAEAAPRGHSMHAPDRADKGDSAGDKEMDEGARLCRRCQACRAFDARQHPKLARTPARLGVHKIGGRSVSLNQVTGSGFQEGHLISDQHVCSRKSPPDRMPRQPSGV
jgi:hypothetical protein